MTNTITSVSDYLEKLKTIAVDEDSQLFYRGVSNEEYATPENNIPSIYRNSGWIENEDKMFYELVSRVPEEFKDCQNTFEYLVKMQHYGYPTRLLDITSNPLVALYFACSGHSDKEGQILTFTIPKNNISNFESDKVTLLSNLAVMDSSISFMKFVINELNTHINAIICFCQNAIDALNYDQNPVNLPGYASLLHFMEKENQEELYQLFDWLENPGSESNESVIKNIKAFKQEIQNGLSKHNNSLDLLKNKRESEIVEFHLKETVNSILKKAKLALLDTTDFISYSSFVRFSHKIKQEKQQFDMSRIIAKDLLAVRCVLPKISNPRISAQSGAFLLFGFKNEKSDKCQKPIIDNSYYIKNIDDLLVICSEHKTSILEELKLLDISSATLFPEIDNVAKEIQTKYEKD